MSAISTYLKVEHIRLEAGEILILDGVIYVIESVEKLVHKEVSSNIVPTGPLAANARGTVYVIANLRPEDDEVYQIEYMGISHEYEDAGARFVFPSGTVFQIAYPRGDPRFTPHGLSVRLDENVASRLDPFRVDLWIKPATEPTITCDNTLNQQINFAMWFYGWKYRTKVITKADLDAARGRNVKVLEIERYVSK